MGLDGDQLEDSGCPLRFCFYLSMGWARPKAHGAKKHSVSVGWLDPRLWWDGCSFKEGLARLGILGTVRSPASESLSRAFDRLGGRCPVRGGGGGGGGSGGGSGSGGGDDGGNGQGCLD